MFSGRIFGFLVAKNEGDIIGQTLQALVEKHCYEKIFFFDNGSDDDTYEVAAAFSSDTVIVARCLEPFSDILKYRLVSECQELRSGDWVQILDADEIIVGDPLALIEEAERTGADTIESDSAQFYLTPEHCGPSFDRTMPAAEQVPHYLINYGERRLFKFYADRMLTETLVKQRDSRLIISGGKLLLMHFQYRSEAQLAKRIALRLENNASSGNWGHVLSSDIRSYLVPERYLHRFDGNFRYGMPADLDLFCVRNNAAYTAASIQWMARNGDLLPDQERVLTASFVEQKIRSLNPKYWFR
jgi:glycosyltransferase involved in cell wall biosynthesis